LLQHTGADDKMILRQRRKVYSVFFTLFGKIGGDTGVFLYRDDF
jgi:hypothetical protein